ncbi:acetylhydrolase [Thalassotalea euphylliae]|uniref:Acetylhydrolase n=2 Tax=Thalassotalea euphylliae TaxID=1655234 RepID=A0A3E0TW92_9GAMM|nr:acetylhydrolase [Thalassotalea euphylliae]
MASAAQSELLSSVKPEQLFTDQPSVMPELATAGNYKVGVVTEQLINRSAFDHRDFQGTYERPLTVELWYPADTGKPSTAGTLASYKAVTRSHKAFELQGTAYRGAAPVAQGQFPFVVISHGYTGDRTIMFYLAEHLASYGYVVASIDHTDSTTEEIDIVNAPTAGFVSTLIHRSRDQQFVLNHYRQQSSALSRLVDFNKAGVIGYSMGGYGAINTVGGCYDVKSASLKALGFNEQQAEALAPAFSFCNAGEEKADTSWQAMVAFAPWGQELNLHNVEALGKLAIPSLYVAGDQDDISGFEHGVQKLYQQTSPQDNYLLVYQNARHNIAPHPAPKVAYQNDIDLGHYFEPSWSSEQLNRFNRHFVLAFLDCYLKTLKCEYLPTTKSSTQKKLDRENYTEAWLGMPHRWATGIEFYRAQPAQ